MSYKSIFVNIEIDSSAVTPLFALGAGLARDFGAHLTGVCAADVPLPTVAANGMVFDGETMMLEREEIESRQGELEAVFSKVASDVGVAWEWRAAVADPTNFLVESARMADLIVTANATGGHYRSVDLGGLALSAGRPVLVAADGASQISSDRVLVAWKDTREARRAVTDSLPMLQRAKEVLVVAIEPYDDSYADNSLLDVLRLLKLHGIAAHAKVEGKPESEAISELARSFNADLVIAGAYGHSRLREWIFGGVTRSLINDGGINRFMSN